MGLLFQTLGAAAGRFADIKQDERETKKEYDLLDYELSQEKDFFDMTQTRAEAQVIAKEKRDSDRNLNDIVKEASLFYKPAQLEAIATYGLSGYKYAIAKAKEYEANGRNASIEFDVGKLRQQISSSDPTKTQSTLEVASTINDSVFSSAFTSIPKATKNAANTFQAQLVQLSSDISKETDPKKKAVLQRQELDMIKKYQSFLDIEKTETGENFQLDFSKETRTALTLGLLDSNFIADGKYQDIRGKLSRLTSGYEADAATIHFNTYETLLNKYGGKKPGEKWNGVRDLNPEDDAFWASIEQINIGGRKLVEDYIGQTVREYQRSKSSEDDDKVIVKPPSYKDRKNKSGGLLTFQEMLQEYNKGIYKTQDVVPFIGDGSSNTDKGVKYFGLISSKGQIHRIKGSLP